MAKVSARRAFGLDLPTLENSARTAVAALLSVTIARLAGLPEAYWAPITTLIIMQSTLGAALAISGKRLLGTAMGAALGALLAGYFGSNIYIFAAGVFVTGVFCGALRIDAPAYRYASITLAIVMLIARPLSPWIIAFHRFAEVSIGIAVGLLMTSVWRETPE